MNPHPTHREATPTPRTRRVNVAAAVDGEGFSAIPGHALVRTGVGGPGSPAVELLALTEDPAELPDIETDDTIDAPNAVLIPGLVNAHTHLDLTLMGPQPFHRRPNGGGFVAWVDAIREARGSGPAADAAAAVMAGVAKSLEGGVVAVGDIAGSFGEAACLALMGSPMVGVSFLELFGVGARAEASAAIAAEMLDRLGAKGPGGGVRVGLQPHSPYSAGLALFRAAAALSAARGVVMSTHLAETPEERELIRDGAGDFAGLLDRFGFWDADVAGSYGGGGSPVAHVAGAIGGAGTLCAHVNDASDADIEMLRDSSATVVYCARASAYFGREHDFGPHRYREMVAAGLPVVLGTDSMVNVPSAQSHRLTTLDDAAMLFRRDAPGAGGERAAFAEMLLGMMTTGGARALGLDAARFAFGGGGSVDAPRGLAGLCLVDVSGVERRGSAAEWVLSAETPRIELVGVAR